MDNNLNQEPKVKGSKIFKKIILMIIAIFLIVGLVYFKNFIKKNTSKEISLTSQMPKDFVFEEITYLEEEKQENPVEKINIKENKEDFENIKNNIKYLEEKILVLEKKIENLQINPKKIDLIQLSLRIQENIQKDLDYNDNLDTFIIILDNNKILQNEIKNLKSVKNVSYNDLKNDFYLELESYKNEINLLNNKENKINYFLSKFITITETKNNQEDSLIIDFEKQIIKKNYEYILNNILINQDIIKYFPKTKNNIEAKNILNTNIKNIINYILNN